MGAEFDKTYTEYQANRSAFRKSVRRLYLASAQRKLRGATLDFGCGIGELLARLPQGSRGLEYNRSTVTYCRLQGLAVEWYDGVEDNWQLRLIPSGAGLQSMVISHVLEHLDEPLGVLRNLMSAASRIGIQRLLVIVPGRAGFRVDKTHRTFVDREMLASPRTLAGTGFRLESETYFPGNIRKLGDWFPYHELQVLYVPSMSDSAAVHS